MDDLNPPSAVGVAPGEDDGDETPAEALRPRCKSTSAAGRLLRTSGESESERVPSGLMSRCLPAGARKTRPGVRRSPSAASRTGRLLRNERTSASKPGSLDRCCTMAMAAGNSSGKLARMVLRVWMPPYEAR
jgi:hypothetical protein